MKRILLISAALLAATSGFARAEKKKAEPKPPPEPVIEYENDDVHMSDPLAEACVAAPAEQETYDSRDNVLVTRIEGGGRAFFHFKSGCDANTMMFADSIKSADGSQCVKPGGALVFTSSYGDVKTCEVAKINRWLDDELISPEDAQ